MAGSDRGNHCAPHSFREEWACEPLRARHVCRGMMSDDCFQRALQAAGIGAWDWNPTTNNIWYSAEAKTILGLPEDSTTSCDKIREAILPADRDATQRALKR